MKIYSAVSFALILILLCDNLFASSKDSTQIISVNVDIIAKDESRGFRNPLDFKEYFITITLINKQDSIVHFGIMTCGWEESFITDNPLLDVVGNGICDGTYPTIIEIKPHKSIKFFTRLRLEIKKSKENRISNFKIGFKDFPLKEFIEQEHSTITKYKIYWSKRINLKPELYTYKKD